MPTLRLVDHVEAKDPERRLADRLGLVTASTHDLLGARTLEEVVESITHRLTDATGAAVGSISLLADEETLALRGIRGAPDVVASRWATFPLASDTPGAEALRKGEPVVLLGSAAIAETYPALEATGEGERSLLCLPLIAADRRLGVVSLSFAGVRTIADGDLGYFMLLADICAHSVERVMALEEAQDREDKLAFLADVTERLVGDLDYESTLTAVAEMAVPRFADWCSIQLVRDGRLHQLAVAHRHPELADLVADLLERYPPSPDAARGAYQVLRSGTSGLASDLSDDLLAEIAQDEDHLELLRQLSFRSAMSCPLIGNGRALGVITWVAGEEGRRYTADDVAFGEDLARRAGLAIDNADLHSQVSDVALRLQRAVLPERLRPPPGLGAAVSYTPAGRTLVGGDFYDVVPLPDGRAAVFVGDVMGRGVEAAAAMAQLRATIRALAVLDPTPEVLLDRLDAVVDNLELDQLVTLVYGLASPSEAGPGMTFDVASAGHPAPLVVRSEGTAEVIALESGLMLGVLASPDRPRSRRVHLAAGDRVLLFSDGLVERPREHYDDGVQRLVEVCRGTARNELEVALASVVEAVRDSDHEDDVTALFLEVGSLPGPDAEPAAPGR